MHVSLCSGIAGLDMAVGSPDQFWEIDAAPSEVLTERFPDVPNHGDWLALDAFDPSATAISAGMPCQPLSGAGKGRGDEDERYLFDHFVRILRASEARPTLYLENVRGLLYPRNREPLARFIRGLADLGYMGRWEVVRASDVGAPHRRERWFCLASHPDGSTTRRDGRATPRPQGEDGRRSEPQVGDGPADGVAAASHPDGEGPQGRRIEELSGAGERAAGESRVALLASRYGPAVERWEALTRPCPAPLDDGDRLSVRFTEWMLGYPDGWVSDILPRTTGLKALGNSVCPQQARLAFAILLNQKGSDEETH